MLIISLRSFNISELPPSEKRVGQNLLIRTDEDTIQCVIVQDTPVTPKDVTQSSDALVATLLHCPRDLQPEVDFYISGNFTPSAIRDFENLADEVWRRFFRGQRDKTGFHSDERCFIRVRARVPIVEQLLPPSENID